MIDIEQLRVDMAAGTPGPWKYSAMGGMSTVLTPKMPPRNDRRCEVAYGYKADNGFCIAYPFFDDDQRTRCDFVCFDHHDARRIARVPDLEAAYLAQAAEIARLRVALNRTADALALCAARFADVADPRDIPQEWRDLCGVAA